MKPYPRIFFLNHRLGVLIHPYILPSKPVTIHIYGLFHEQCQSLPDLLVPGSEARVVHIHLTQAAHSFNGGIVEVLHVLMPAGDRSLHLRAVRWYDPSGRPWLACSLCLQQ